MAKNPNSGSAAHHVRRKGLHSYVKRPKAAVPKESSWSVPDLCKAYDWPTTAPGGAVIAIIELGGGWTERTLQVFCLNLPPPHITNVSVDGTQNSQCNPKDADAEVALDIRVAGAPSALAAGQPPNIRVYWSQDITKAISPPLRMAAMFVRARGARTRQVPASSPRRAGAGGGHSRPEEWSCRPCPAK